MCHDLDGRPAPATVPSSVNRAPAGLGLAGRPGALAGKRTHCISSARADWPDLRATLDHARGGDVLVTWKLDRFSRSLPHRIEMEGDVP